jgi:ATP/maltotriose-dependent transcriptional regulator MalT
MSEELIGRDEELRLVEGFLAGIARGGRALAVLGEAGIGKTSLVRATLGAAAARGDRVISARPAEAETGFAFSALGDLLRPSLAEVHGLPPPQRRALEVALLVAQDDRAVDQQAISLAALAVFRSLARRSPVVVAIDDAPWLDLPSAAVLRFVSRRLADLPVGMLVSARSKEGASPPLGLERAFPADRLVLLTLGAMSFGAIQRLLRERLGLVLPRPTLRRLYELSGGNPFFALELGRAYRAGDVRLEQGELLPVTLEGLVRDRLAAVSVEARRVAAAAAAMALPTEPLIRAAVGVGPLGELERARIIELRDGRLRFVHPLLASAAYTSVERAERRAIHAAIAAMVSDVEERARHLALASEGVDGDVARVLDEAAARAEARGAPGSAAELYGWAARLTPPRAAVDACRRKVDAAFCVFESGDSKQARELLEEIVSRLRPGQARARALVCLARVRSYDDDLLAAEALFRQALQEAAGDAELAAAAQEGVAATLFRLRERLDEAVEHAGAAATAAAASGDVGLQAEALGSRLLAEAALGRTRARETLEVALALQEACEHRRALAQPLFPVGVVWLWFDELDRARTAFEQLYARGRERGEESSLPYLLVLLAQVDWLRGEFSAAARHAEEGYGLTEQAGQATLGAYLLALQALIDAAAGNTGPAREKARRALELARETSGRPAEQFARAALGLLHLSLGAPDEAVRAMRPQVERIRAEGIAEPGAARFVTDQVEALIELGETRQAEELLDWYEGNSRRLSRASALAVCARCRALLAAARGDLDRALSHLEHALAVHDEVAVPLERARTLLALGATRRRARHKRAARDSLQSAGELFERIGARVWCERAVAELGRIGGRAPSSGELTTTERRVAELVAQGLATKQVAGMLFVSPKTVEGHLSSIYAKLGVHSRTELAHRLTTARRL